MNIPRYSLYVIPDELHSAYEFADIIKMVLEGGANMIQLRDRTRSLDEWLMHGGRYIRSIAADYSVPFIVNDRVDLAMLLKADGVHLGQEDLPVAEVRKLMGEEAIIGVSCGTVQEALEAELCGASYIGFGHMYPTSSKKKSTPQRTLEELREVSSAVKIPVIAIGGITVDKVAELLQAGAAGVAVIGAICRSEDPQAMTMEFRKAIDSALSRLLER